MSCSQFVRKENNCTDLRKIKKKDYYISIDIELGEECTSRYSNIEYTDESPSPEEIFNQQVWVNYIYMYNIYLNYWLNIYT